MEHLNQIQRAVDYIEERLREDLPVETVARVAGFSMWHFQMVFRSTVGLPLKEYVRKRRLSLAMLELGSSERRILDIALDAGFESQEAFSRAFKSVFGMNPGKCDLG